MRIRPAHLNDIPALIAVFQASVRGTCGADYSPPQIDAWAGRGTDARFQELFDCGLCFFMAEDDVGGCAGYAAVSAQGTLHSLFVSPAFQRQGVAGALLEAVIGFAREHGAPRLEAEVSLTALPFFRQAGFCVEQEQQVAIGDVCFTNFRMWRAVPVR